MASRAQRPVVVIAAHLHHPYAPYAGCVSRPEHGGSWWWLERGRTRNGPPHARCKTCTCIGAKRRPPWLGCCASCFHVCQESSLLANFVECVRPLLWRVERCPLCIVIYEKGVVMRLSPASNSVPPRSTYSTGAHGVLL